MRGCRILNIIKCIVFVVLAVIAVVVSGCREVGERESERETHAPDGNRAVSLEPPAYEGETGGENLVWAWPSREEAEAVTGDSPGWGRTVFFRFREAPSVGSLRVEVRPEAYYRLEYAGQVVLVELETLGEPPYEVTLKDLEGKVLGRAYVGRPQWEAAEPPFVRVAETRTWTRRDGTSGSRFYRLSERVKDQDTVVAGHGSVSVSITVPSDVSEQTLRDAVRFEPSEGVEMSFREWETAVPESETLVRVRTLTVTWPGVADSGRGAVNPADVVESAPVPPGFTLEMKVFIDAEKLPVFKEVSGSDGVFSISVSRSTPAECSVRSLDDASVKVPYDGFRTIYSVKPGPLRFLLTFTKPVDRASVERAVASLVTHKGARRASFSFAWNGDQELECEIAFPTVLDWHSIGEIIRLDVAGSLDLEGLPISFFEPMVIRLAVPATLAEVFAEDPQGPIRPVVELPPGISAATLSPGGEFMVGLEPVDPYWGVQSSAEFHMWVYSFSSGRWTDLGSSIPPVQDARWLGAESIVAWDRTGWEIVQARSGEVKRVNWENESGLSLLGLCPSPDGSTLAIVQGARYRSEYDPADLILCDLEGNVIRCWPEITGTNIGDGYQRFVPIFYTDWVKPGIPRERTQKAGAEPLPDGPSGTVFLVDRPRNGPTRVLSVDVQSGPLSVVPGTEQVPRATLVVFGTDPAYLAFPRPFGIYVVDLETGELAQVARWISTITPADFAGRSLLPSPDGRFLAVDSTLIDLQKIPSGGPPEGQDWPKLPGPAVGWSADGSRVYILRWP